MINRRLLQAMLAAAVFAGSVNIVSAAAAPKKASRRASTTALKTVLLCACAAASAEATTPEDCRVDFTSPTYLKFLKEAFIECGRHNPALHPVGKDCVDSKMRDKRPVLCPDVVTQILDEENFLDLDIEGWLVNELTEEINEYCRPSAQEKCPHELLKFQDGTDARRHLERAQKAQQIRNAKRDKQACKNKN